MEVFSVLAFAVRVLDLGMEVCFVLAFAGLVQDLGTEVYFVLAFAALVEDLGTGVLDVCAFDVLGSGLGMQKLDTLACSDQMACSEIEVEEGVSAIPVPLHDLQAQEHNDFVVPVPVLGLLVQACHLS